MQQLNRSDLFLPASEKSSETPRAIDDFLVACSDLHSAREYLEDMREALRDAQDIFNEAEIEETQAESLCEEFPVPVKKGDNYIIWVTSDDLWFCPLCARENSGEVCSYIEMPQEEIDNEDNECDECGDTLRLCFEAYLSRVGA